MSFWAILLAGGSGVRMGQPRNKVLLKVAGVPALIRSARALSAEVEGIVAVVREADRAEAAALLDGACLPCPVRTAPGGDTRQDSVWAGLQALPPECTHVLIHDAARCLVDAETIRGVMAAALSDRAAAAAVPVTDTLRAADSQGLALRTVDRAGLYAMQTPQGFERELIIRAHQQAQEQAYVATDDAALVEAMEMPVRLTPGSRTNLKLTIPEDLAMAEALLQSEQKKQPLCRIGSGYDVHRLVPDRKLVLCGVEVPHSLGLLGHSDADVALHALMDALLGACALGDIGRHFPDTAAEFAGISSLLLLRRTAELIAEAGYAPGNVDITIAAQKPKLAPYIGQMRQQVAETLGLPVDCVSIKATTTERLGFEGREEGISAQATALVYRVG